jgi:hypothetical protein
MGAMVTRLQGFKVARFQSRKVSKSQGLKVARAKGTGYMVQGAWSMAHDAGWLQVTGLFEQLALDVK